MSIKRLFQYLLFFTASFLHGQSTHILQLDSKGETIDINNRSFYIQSVLDNRKDKKQLGTVYDSTTNSHTSLILDKPLGYKLYMYYQDVLSKKKGDLPISINIIDLKLSDEKVSNQNVVRCHIVLEYYYKNLRVLTLTKSTELKGTDIFMLHEKNLKSILQKAIKSVEKTTWEKRFLTLKKDNAKERSDTKEEEINKYISDSQVTFGYQIGGYGYFGVDFLYRGGHNIGIHLGVGYPGFTTGLKIFPSSRSNGFINLCYKDYGFGKLSTFALEFGGVIEFNKLTGTGLQLQASIGRVILGGKKIKITYRSNGRENSYYSGKDFDYLITFGVGIRIMQ